jgi:hypothetical protein
MEKVAIQPKTQRDYEVASAALVKPLQDLGLEVALKEARDASFKHWLYVHPRGLGSCVLDPGILMAKCSRERRSD